MKQVDINRELELNGWKEIEQRLCRADYYDSEALNILFELAEKDSNFEAIYLISELDSVKVGNPNQCDTFHDVLKLINNSKKYDNIIDYILEKKIPDNIDSRAVGVVLRLMAQKQQWVDVKSILDRLDNRAHLFHISRVFSIAINYNKLDLVELMLNKFGYKDIAFYQFMYLDSIKIAAKNGSYDILKAIIEACFDAYKDDPIDVIVAKLNIKDALYEAGINSHWAVVDLIIEKFSTCPYVAPDLDRLLYTAIIENNYDRVVLICKYLKSYQKLSLIRVSKEFELAASDDKYVNILRFMLQNLREFPFKGDGDDNSWDCKKISDTLSFASGNRWEIAKVILEEAKGSLKPSGSVINVQFNMAVLNGNLEIVDIILNNQYVSLINIKHSFTVAAQNGALDIMKSILLHIKNKRKDFSKPDIQNMVGLMFYTAARIKQWDSVMFILKNPHEFWYEKVEIRLLQLFCEAKYDSLNTVLRMDWANKPSILLLNYLYRESEKINETLSTPEHDNKLNAVMSAITTMLEAYKTASRLKANSQVLSNILKLATRSHQWDIVKFILTISHKNCQLDARIVSQALDEGIKHKQSGLIKLAVKKNAIDVLEKHHCVILNKRKKPNGIITSYKKSTLWSNPGRVENILDGRNSPKV